MPFAAHVQRLKLSNTKKRDIDFRGHHLWFYRWGRLGRAETVTLGVGVGFAGYESRTSHARTRRKRRQYYPAFN